MESREGKNCVRACVCIWLCILCMHMQFCNVRYRERHKCVCVCVHLIVFLCMHMQCCIVRDGKSSCQKTRDCFDLRIVFYCRKGLGCESRGEVVLMKVHEFGFACARMETMMYAKTKINTCL